MKAQLAAFISQRRLAHSLGVAEAARGLAQRHCPELSGKAELAGLFHDHAKGLSNEELLANARRLDIELSPIEASHPSLLHGKVGAGLLSERFGIDDPEVTQAVSDHVTGRAGMGLLSIVVFVADQAAADRSFSGVENLRRVSEESLDRAALLVAQHKLLYSLRREQPVEPTTVAVYNELLGRIKEHGHE